MFKNLSKRNEINGLIAIIIIIFGVYSSYTAYAAKLELNISTLKDYKLQYQN